MDESSTSNVARELSEKSLETFLFRLLAQAAATTMGIVIARVLGPEGKGLFAYAIAAFTILATLAGGQSAAVTWQYGRCKTPSGSVYTAMMRYFAIIVLPIAAAVIGFGTARHQPPLVAAGIAFPLSYFNLLTLAFFLADRNVRWQNIQGVVIAGGQAILVILACLLVPRNMDWIFAAWILPQAAMVAVSYLRVRPYARREDRSVDLHALFRSQLGYSLRNTLNQVVWSLNLQIDVFIILWMLGAKSAGLYSVAVGLGQLMWYISRPLAASSVGHVTGGTKSQSAYVTAMCLKHALYSVAAACVILALAGPAAIRLVYGERFAGAGLALECILPGIIAYCSLPFFSQFFNLQLGKPSYLTGMGLFSIGVCAAVTIVLLPHIGIVAGAIGTSVSYVASFAVMTRAFCRETGISPATIFVLRRSDLRHYRTLFETAVAGTLRVFARASRAVR